MLPVIAIIGRPNVGKSTLFNAITRSRDALVADRPGVTRDRHYGVARIADQPVVVVDTGGLSDDSDPIVRLTSDQARQAIAEADTLLFVVDAREGLNAEDQRIAGELRGTGKPVVLVANKVDGLDADTALVEFHGLGLARVAAVSAATRASPRCPPNAWPRPEPPTRRVLPVCGSPSSAGRTSASPRW